MKRNQKRVRFSANEIKINVGQLYVENVTGKVFDTVIKINGEVRSNVSRLVIEFDAEKSYPKIRMTTIPEKQR